MTSAIAIPTPSPPNEAHETEPEVSGQPAPEPAVDEVTTNKFSKSFEGKVALVTGIQSPRARKIARRFCVYGGLGVTIAHAPQEEAVACAMKEAITTKTPAAKVLLHVVPGDLGSEDAGALIAAHMKTWGRLDFLALHYNTRPLREGIGEGTITVQHTFAAVDAVVQSFLDLCKAAAAHVREDDGFSIFFCLRDVGMAPLLDLKATERKIKAFMRALEGPPDPSSGGRGIRFKSIPLRRKRPVRGELLPAADASRTH